MRIFFIVFIITSILSLHGDLFSDEKKCIVEHSVDNIEILPFASINLNGYFRIRSDLFYRLDLGGLPSSPFKEPLSLNPVNKDNINSSSFLSSTNMRLRIEPSLLVGEKLSIKLQFDIFDNLVLGSNPEFKINNPYSPISFFSQSQKEEVKKRDSIRVKRVYGEWFLFNHILLTFGRTPDHWGVGILRNSGDCPDCDFGDSVDRIGFQAKIKDVYFGVSLDYIAEGRTSEAESYSYGQPYALEWEDDVTRWTFKLMSVPLTIEEKKSREEKLKNGKVVFDWGLYNSLTSQNLSSEKISPILPPLCMEYKDRKYLPNDCYSLVKRGAFFWSPDIWLELQWWKNPDLKLKLALEFALVYGSIENVQSFLQINTPKDFLSFGTAFEGDLEYKRTKFSLKFGFASGDDDKYFGILDAHNIVEPDDNKYGANKVVSLNKKVTNFKFNRDYLLDLILFREIIGAVTNAFYVNPKISYIFSEIGKNKIGGEFSLLSAFAPNPSSTPGEESPLGIESDFRFFYEFGDLLKFDISSGILFPLGALRDKVSNKEPQRAFRIRGRIFLFF